MDCLNNRLRFSNQLRQERVARIRTFSPPVREGHGNRRFGDFDRAEEFWIAKCLTRCEVSIVQTDRNLTINPQEDPNTSLCYENGPRTYSPPSSVFWMGGQPNSLIYHERRAVSYYRILAWLPVTHLPYQTEQRSSFLHTRYNTGKTIIDKNFLIINGQPCQW